jgi:hypothetical protein
MNRRFVVEAVICLLAVAWFVMIVIDVAVTPYHWDNGTAQAMVRWLQ